MTEKPYLVAAQSAGVVDLSHQSLVNPQLFSLACLANAGLPSIDNQQNHQPPWNTHKLAAHTPDCRT